MGVRSEPARSRWRLGGRSIRFRIVSAFALALTALLAAQGFLFWQNQLISQSLTLMSRGYLPLAKVTSQLERDHDRLKAGSSPTSAAQSLSDNVQIALVVCSNAERRAPTPEEVAFILRLREAYVAVGAQLAERATSTDVAATDARIATSIDQLGRRIDMRIRNLTLLTELAQTRATSITGALAALALAVSALLIGATIVALSPIQRLTEQVQRVAAGDYTGRVELRSDDELGVLAREFNAMAEAIALRDRRLVERADELNRLSRYLSSVLDSLSDALFVVEGGVVTLANPAARQAWALELDAPPPEPLAPIAAAPGLHELARDGAQHEVRVHAFGERGYVIVASDVTERLRDRERLARSERLALVGQMLAQITHEVRNPLNSLSLNADLLLDDLQLLDPERKSDAWELQALIAREIDRLTQLTGHYLELARRPRARLDGADLADVVRDVARLMRPELEQRGATLDVTLDPLEPQLVDGNQLRQAVLNVLRNATEAGAQHLHLRLRVAGDEAIVELQDDGGGMDATIIERALDPFYTTKATGSGLGLAITRQILDDHGGALRIDSALGVGTRLQLALPLRPVPPEAQS